jgi:hypothetical protein
MTAPPQRRTTREQDLLILESSTLTNAWLSSVRIAPMAWKPHTSRSNSDFVYGLALAPAGAQLDAAASVEQDAVTWANAWTDTDFLWRAEALGARWFMHVRSAESPEAFVLDVDLPPGARLLPATDGAPCG